MDSRAVLDENRETFYTNFFSGAENICGSGIIKGRKKNFLEGDILLFLKIFDDGAFAAAGSGIDGEHVECLLWKDWLTILVTSPKWSVDLVAYNKNAGRYTRKDFFC